MSTPSENLRDRWLEALLPRVRKSGWSMVAAKQAAREIDLSTGEQALAAPNGVTDLIDHLLRHGFFEPVVFFISILDR